jgi:hypothetical protein
MPLPFGGKLIIIPYPDYRLGSSNAIKKKTYSMTQKAHLMLTIGLLPHLQTRVESGLLCL